MYFVLNMTWTHCEVYWDLDFESFENEWRAASGIRELRCLACLEGYFLAWVLIDTIIHPCFKHAVSHVARVCAFGHWNPSSRTPLIVCVLLVNLTTLFVDGFGFEHDLDALWILLGSGFWTSGIEASVFGVHFWDSIDLFCFWWLLRFQGDILWKC